MPLNLKIATSLFLSLSLSSLSLSSVALLSSPQSFAEAVTPKLFLESGELLDLLFEMQVKKEIPRDVKNELKARTVEFQNEWDLHSRHLIEMSEKLCGRQFSRREYSVSLVLGPYIPMARPFIMNMQPYLQTTMAPKPASSVKAFVALLHHELLHHLLDNTEGEEFRKFSKLIQKYDALLRSPRNDKEDLFVESIDNVLAHIHLMALQKSVYEKLNRIDLLAEAENAYIAQIGGAYAKAWEIVRQEGTSPFLRELFEFNEKSQAERIRK